MAQWGQGDERWIVEDRKDGQNVNQWHWTEKDCLNWCKQKFKELFEGASLVDSAGVSAKVTSVDKLEGEAFLNVRKKKIIPSYELDLVLGFQATVGEDTVAGKVWMFPDLSSGSCFEFQQYPEENVQLPYLAEENHDEDPEVQVKPETDTAAARTVKDAIYNNKAKAIFPKVQEFVDEFHAGKAAGHNENAAANKPVAKDHTGAQAAAAPAPKPEAKKASASNSSTTGGVKRGSNRIEIKETFYCSAGDIYDVFLNEARVKAFTMSDASVSKEVGGKFTMFGGSIEGVHRELVPGKKIVQDWRFTTWPDNLYSSVTMEIEEPEPGHTTVKMTQEGVPEEDNYGNRNVVDTTRNGWHQLIFFKIKAVFGYGV